MNRSSMQLVAMGVIGALMVAVSVAVGYVWARHHTANDAMSSMNSATSDRKVLYWYDPMVPSQHFDQPGKSPFMDMALQPKYAGDDASDSGIQISTHVTQNLGIRLATVERRTLSSGIVAAGTIGFNERELAIVQARTNGFISRVYARAPGDIVAAGAPIVDIQVPEWSAAQNEFLALRRASDIALVDAARERLHALGMLTAAIAALERSGQPQTTVTITAPISGVIQTLNARMGMTVSSGMSLAEINGLSTVWLTAAVPETLGAQIHVGDSLSAQLAASPDETLSGRVIAILPQTDAASRTLAVRAEMTNPDGRLRPGQFARINFSDVAENTAVLVVPSEAVIRSGARNVVIRAHNGHFQPLEVSSGREADGHTEIISGLQEGQQVVASGQFLIDSEANLTGVLARMETAAPDAASMNASQIAATYEAIGTVEQIEEGQITLSHEPVPALGWGAMTMPFALVTADAARDIRAGDRVTFTFHQTGNQFVIDHLEKADNRSATKSSAKKMEENP